MNRFWCQRPEVRFVGLGIPPRGVDSSCSSLGVRVDLANHEEVWRGNANRRSQPLHDTRDVTKDEMSRALQSLAILSERNLGPQSAFLALKALGIARDDKRDPRHRRITAVPIWEGMQQKGSIELLAHILFTVIHRPEGVECMPFKGAHLIILLNSVSVHVPVSIHRCCERGAVFECFFASIVSMMNWWPQCNPQNELLQCGKLTADISRF